MAVRHRLHLSKIQEFAEWAESLGFREEPAKGYYEVLRLRLGRKPPLIYHRRHTGDHATAPDNSEADRLVKRWIRER